MPKYALIKNNVVRAVVNAPSSFATNVASKFDYVIDVTASSNPPERGDGYNGSVFQKGTNNRPEYVARRTLINKLLNLGLYPDEIRLLGIA